ncbi:EAL domain-containing protein [Aliarcobacter skirrowii]|uniref:Diguanylate cyclase n=2 Tax=Aliarcobacter skirrowii TaxID=28200 RepID=A0AAD0SNF9_9BACT|nr:EAL domain-containing protein [Aliarcobacter skirrowii]AXX85397.1 response regulator receiver-modulated diguanylate cyclase/phosphodiesterase [Aliarcobacter skirrowii CCUG 10374]KAB0621191.1 EAL domain-containing protein [Aliarcobacter skirrowii CCUG 10374]MDY0181170.1 EAL domain-containing protein [Aliarcobacter skirrowii]RXI26361.1 diguanylate cyclase [Aliarcobacter skirrowii CCUG 10374]SUU96070.1 Bacteriophytochrome cph2 [Aliarcobacter skirrowii]
MNKDIDRLKNVNVLYAEDEKELRDITSEFLKSFTKTQYVASNGEEGFNLFLEHQDSIDLIITDINMPILSGMDMIKKIKEINPKIPIIIATAFSNKEYLLEAINIGVDKYVLKPIDISKLLQAMLQSLNYHELKDLYTDNLTKLANKNRLQKDLKYSNNDLLALLDIDEFLATNDLFGEKIGDKILIEFASKMRNYFSSKDFSLYRIESDKFAVSPKNTIDIDTFFVICRDFLDTIESDAFLIDDNEIDVNVTIGIAKGDGEQAYKYTKRIINYARKKFQKIMIYEDSYNIHKSFEQNIMWIKLLKQGFKENLLKAFFQPIVDTKTKEVLKYEALIRYISLDGKVHGPYEFLEVAKKTRLYQNIVKVILDDSLKLIKEKKKKVSINISYVDLIDDKTKKYIYDFLEKNREFVNNLEFELLESEEIIDFNIIKDFITNVSKYSCKVGIDDFGAGYSNFHILSKLDISFVKIDGSLIKDIHNSKELEIIVRTIASIAKDFHIKTIAEFVATENIYEKVKALNIDYSQGYYFDKPLTFEEIV